MKPSLPRWIDSLPDDERPGATQRYLIRLAALHASDAGTLGALAVALGRSKNAMTRHVQPVPDRVPVQLALDIERLVGRAVVPREALLPEVFALPE